MSRPQCVPLSTATATPYHATYYAAPHQPTNAIIHGTRTKWVALVAMCSLLALLWMTTYVTSPSSQSSYLHISTTGSRVSIQPSVPPRSLPGRMVVPPVRRPTSVTSKPHPLQGNGRSMSHVARVVDVDEAENDDMAQMIKRLEKQFSSFERDTDMPILPTKDVEPPTLLQWPHHGHWTEDLDAKFEPLHFLGVGARAAVWHCRDRETGDDVAVKILVNPATTSTRYAPRYQSPRNAAADLIKECNQVNRVRASLPEDQKRYIPECFPSKGSQEFGDDNDPIYMVMQYAGSHTLYDAFFDPSIDLDGQTKRRILHKTIQAIQAISAQGWSHHDIKWQNVIISEATDDVVLADLAAAIHLDDENKKIEATAVFTPWWDASGGFGNRSMTSMDGTIQPYAYDIYCAGLMLLVSEMTPNMPKLVGIEIGGMDTGAVGDMAFGLLHFLNLEIFKKKWPMASYDKFKHQLEEFVDSFFDIKYSPSIQRFFGTMALPDDATLLLIYNMLKEGPITPERALADLDTL